ncbi:MAG: hypothetical protein H7Z14_03195, partial [Anaerolineae bacterium]|nr:hypothetical protein [Phycisphaerae bacterium]
MIRSIVCAVLLFVATSARAERINASDLAMKSSGEKSGTSWTLSQNGFVGTYIRVGKAGDVSIAVRAPSAQQAKLSVVVADMSATTVALSAGTYFVRVQSNANAPVTIDSLEINGAKIVNQHTDANALAAA